MNKVSKPHSVRILRSFDTEHDAAVFADAEFRAGRYRVGVMTTLEWNRYHPEQQVNTINRYVVYREGT